MPIWIKDPSTIPSGGFRYPHVAAGQFITVFNYQLLYPAIKQVYESNNQPVPSMEDVIKYQCDNLFISCYEGQEPFANSWLAGIPPVSPAGCCGKVAPMPVREEAI